MPGLEEASDSGDEEGWEEWDCESTVISAKCLFCEQCYGSVEQLFEHCTQGHGVDIKQVVQQLQLDDFAYIKMVNFIRRQVK